MIQDRLASYETKKTGGVSRRLTQSEKADEGKYWFKREQKGFNSGKAFVGNFGLSRIKLLPIKSDKWFSLNASQRD